MKKLLLPKLWYNDLSVPIEEAVEIKKEFFYEKIMKSNDDERYKLIDFENAQNEILACICYNHLIDDLYTHCCVKTLKYYYLDNNQIFLYSEPYETYCNLDRREKFEELDYETRRKLFIELLIVLYHAKTLYYMQHKDVGNGKNIIIEKLDKPEERLYVCGTMKIRIKSQYKPRLINYTRSVYGKKRYEEAKSNDIAELCKHFNDWWLIDKDIKVLDLKIIESKKWEQDIYWILELLINHSNP
jgi:hypothetical protein